MTLDELKQRCQQYNDCPSLTVLKLLEMIEVLRRALTQEFRIYGSCNADAALERASEIERSL